MDLSRLRRHAWLVDLAAAVLLVAFAASAWHTGPRPGDPPVLPGTPAWAAFSDLTLDGPDAGRWAEQVQALQAGDPSRLDGHRLPSWSLWTWAVAAVGGLSIPLAGHLGNHLLRLLLAPLAYALGRGVALGRAPAAAFAALVVTLPTVTANSERYGVDTAVTVAWVAALAAPALLVARGAAGAVLAGMVAGVAAATHLTTLPVVVPALWMAAAAAPVGGRARRVGAFALGVAVAVGIVFTLVPALPPGLVVPTLLQGIVPLPADASPTTQPAPGQVAAVVASSQGGAADALARWVAVTLGAGRLPGAALAVLIALGAFAPGLAPRPERPPAWLTVFPRAARLPLGWATRGAGAGLGVLGALAALPLYFVVAAPTRYLDTLAPLLLLLLVRGAAAAGAVLDGTLARWGSPAGLGAGALGVAGVALLAHELPQPAARRLTGDDTLLVQVGADLAARHGVGGPLVTSSRELAVLAGAVACPRKECPYTSDRLDVRQCADRVRSECDVDGIVRYVVTVRAPDDRLVPRRELDARAAAAVPPSAEWTEGGSVIVLLDIPATRDW